MFSSFIDNSYAVVNVRASPHIAESCLFIHWDSFKAGNCEVFFDVEYRMGRNIIGMSKNISNNFVCKKEYSNFTSITVWNYINYIKGLPATYDLSFNKSSMMSEKNFRAKGTMFIFDILLLYILAECCHQGQEMPVRKSRAVLHHHKIT